MKDEDYFDGQLFVYTNTELKKEIQDLADERGENMYLLVDEALREKLHREDVKFESAPKKPTLQ